MESLPPGASLVDRSFTFQQLADLSLDLLAVADLSTASFLWLSPNWSDVLGWSLDELTEGSFLRFVHPDDVASTRAEVANLLRGAEVVRFLNRYRTRTGEYRSIEWNATPYGDGAVFSIARDITKSTLRDRVDTERSRLLELASEVGRMGYWRVDLETTAVWWSSEVFRIHGRPQEAGFPTLEEAVAAYHPDDREQVNELLRAAAEERHEFDFELRIFRADGAMRTVVARAQVESGPKDEATSVFGTIRDVTDERAAQARQRQNERLVSLGTLAAGIAHEINNPLTYVLGNLAMLLEDLEEGEHAQMARDAVDGAEHVKRIVDGLRTFSWVGEPGERESVSMDQVLASAVQLSANQLRHRADLVREGTGLPNVLGERALLVQVVCNLLVNAAHAMPRDRRGTIRLRGFRDGNDVVVDVEDDGPGVPDEVRARIFDPFFTTKSVGDGTGLGLSICIGTVESHGGSLTLMDGRPGRTCFRVRLPIDDVERPVSAKSEPLRPDDIAGDVVMVVDDDPQITRMIARALPNFTVIAHQSAESALEALLAGLRPRVVLCDVLMPGMSGWAMHDVLVANFPEVAGRTVYITGGAFSPDAEQFLARLAPERRLLKPFRPAELRRVVLATRRATSGPE